MIKITYDAGRVNMAISGNGVVLLTEAECITLVLYDKLKETMGEDIANRYAKKSIEMLHNGMRGLDFDGKPFCSAAEQKPEKHEE